MLRQRQYKVNDNEGLKKADHFIEQILVPKNTKVGSVDCRHYKSEITQKPKQWFLSALVNAALEREGKLNFTS